MKRIIVLAFSLLSSMNLAAADTPTNLEAENLVAWCIVPFDATKRTPEQRAAMLAELGLKHCAYDWRAEHIPTFEAEILAYRKQGIEFTAFWDTHPAAFALFEKYSLSPQIWKTAPSPEEPDHAARIQAAADALEPLAAQATRIGSKLGLYNHGGWGGEPENLIAVCQELHKRGHTHTGIVYNLHHAHHRITTFATDLQLMKPHLLCLNLNGTNSKADPGILPIGKGEHDAALLKTIIASGYTGPIGILDHRSEIDAKSALQENLTGLRNLLQGMSDNGS